MALIHLDELANPDVCPTCAGRDLGPAIQGRLTRKWLRHCRAPHCATTLVLASAPLAPPVSGLVQSRDVGTRVLPFATEVE